MRQHKYFVFFDHSGKRWKTAVRFAFALLLIISVFGAIFSFSVLVLPATPLSLPNPIYTHIHIPKLLISREDVARKIVARKSRDELMTQIAHEARRRNTHPGASAKPYSTVIGFYVNWEPASYASLSRHIESLTYIMPEWYTLNADGKSFSMIPDSTGTNSKVIKLSKNYNVPIIPMIKNFTKGSWDWESLHKLLSNPDTQRDLAENLRDELRGRHFAGINIDFEPAIWSIKDTTERAKAQKLAYEKMPEFMSTLRKVFKPAHLLVTQDVLVSDNTKFSDQTFDYEKLGKSNDLVVAMLYDQHVPTSAPGPIAAQTWIEKCAENLFFKIDSSKVILGIGNYCYDWPITWDKGGNIKLKHTGISASLGSVLRVAGESGAAVNMDDMDLNPYFTYADNTGDDHIIYMLDAVTAYNQIMALKGYEPRGAALWYMGSEDPSIWKFFSQGNLGKTMRPSAFDQVAFTSGVGVDIESKGELMQVVSSPTSGERKITMDSDGLIDSEDYSKYPSPYIIRRYGDKSKTIALTFDDGPDPTFTPQILRILKENHVPGTFFVLGSNAEMYPEILEQMWDDGNEIGNHTFTHPHFAEISAWRAALEVNATQRIIESITGRSTRLFRPPFGEGGDTNAADPDEIVHLLETQKLGYITVGMNIDPNDYEKPGVDEIVNRIDRIIAQANHNLMSYNVILMHDGGGDRSQTVAALPKIIKDLKGKGYKFIPVSGLLGAGGRDKMFPPVTHHQGAFAGFDLAMLELSFFVTRFVQAIFLISIVLGILRILLVAPLAILQARRARKAKYSPEYAPEVTVIIPGYNEEGVICKTIHSVLQSDYPNMHVIVVDDGSTDNTAMRVQTEFASEPRLTFIRKENGGKSTALNLGISMVESEVVVCLDADTIFAADTISKLVRHFADPRVGAVAGNVKVGNRNNPLTIWQSLEYITSQNFDRRAYAALNSVTVVPGAIGAWRRSAILEAGGYGMETLAEDTDLTFKIRLLGYHIATENEALAYTEAPEGVHNLARQRFRWSFGTLQCLFKHRRVMFKREYGAFSIIVMPAMWIYNIFFQAFSPIVDIAVVLSILNHQFYTALIYYAAFFVIDFLGSALALKLDDEDPKQLAWLFWQRFFYRQFMYYVIIKSIVAALKGGMVGWGKLQRKDSVSKPAADA